jgi:hypothetical protein
LDNDEIAETGEDGYEHDRGARDEGWSARGRGRGLMFCLLGRV